MSASQDWHSNCPWDVGDSTKNSRVFYQQRMAFGQSSPKAEKNNNVEMFINFVIHKYSHCMQVFVNVLLNISCIKKI